LFNFINTKLQKNLSLFNFFITLVSFFYLYKTFQIDLTLFKFSFNYFIFIFFTILMNFFLASAWSYLFYNKFSINVTATWLISGIGKYVPFKIGLVSKRYIYSKLYKSDKPFTRYLIIEFFLNFAIFFVFSLIGFLEYKLYLISLIFVLLLIFRQKLNIKVFFCNVAAFIANMFALTFFYYLNFTQINFDFVFNYILTSVVGNLFVGSPAGIGIRESIFMNYTQFYTFESQFFTLLVLLRILYILSDVLSYFFGYVLLELSKKEI